MRIRIKNVDRGKEVYFPNFDLLFSHNTEGILFIFIDLESISQTADELALGAKHS